MRIYNFEVKQVKHSNIIGYGDIFNGEMFRISKNGKYLFTIELPFMPTKNYLKKVISRNYYRPLLPF